MDNNRRWGVIHTKQTAVGRGCAAVTEREVPETNDTEEGDIIDLVEIENSSMALES